MLNSHPLFFLLCNSDKTTITNFKCFYKIRPCFYIKKEAGTKIPNLDFFSNMPLYYFKLFTSSTKFSTVNPYSAKTFGAGADAPKVSIPRTAPSRPTYLYQF